MAATVSSSFSNPSQLCFDWMHEDDPSRTLCPIGPAIHGSRTRDQKVRDRSRHYSGLHRGCSDAQGRGIGRGNWRDDQKTCRSSEGNVGSSRPIYPQIVKASRSERTGEVKLGDVMLKLLKRYGITEEEIAAALAPECS